MCSFCHLCTCDDEGYVYIFGHENIKFATEDKNNDYMSIMDVNMRVCTSAIGLGNTYFMFKRYKFIEKKRFKKIVFSIIQSLVVTRLTIM